MASQTMMRAAATSPARATFAKMPRSILKRPAPLALSPNPFPFSSSVTVQISPVDTSPHVHFPPSPSLFALFTAHSPGTYDRAPIMVSPNPLTLPSWGDRVYSPTLNGFKSYAYGSPQPFPLSIYNSPTVNGFEDPRSPKEKVQRERLIAFASQPAGRRSHELAKALSSYPRSPYPSAPISPAEFGDSGGEEATRGRTKYRERGDMIRSLPARARARAKSVEEERRHKRQVAPLNPAPRQFKAGALSPFMSMPSPLSQSFMSASQEPTLARDNKPPPLDLEPASSRLSQAFWQSVSLEDSESVPSPAFPESVSGSKGSSEGAVAFRRETEHLMFAGKDGALWSPRVEHQPAAGSILSPAQKVAFKNLTHSMVASPSPNDPFAAFPSFSVVLSSTSGVDPSIAYPPRVKVGRASERF